MKMQTKATNQNCILLRSNIEEEKNSRTVKHYDAISKQDEEGIIKLYEALAPESEDSTIDVEMIYSKAFPAFEETVGKSDFAKVKRYFGIGAKAPNKNVRREDVQIILGRMNTIENACYYLTGFEETLEKIAAKLKDAPDCMSAIEKAKLVRIFFIICNSYHFFAEDYRTSQVNGQLGIDYQKALRNNKMSLNPEEVFYLYRANVEQYGDNTILYEMVMEMFRTLDKRLRKEIFEVAELKCDNSCTNVTSINVRKAEINFGYIRKLKVKAFPQLGYFPIEMYCITDVWKKMEFGELYCLYKILKCKKLEEFPIVERKIPRVEGNRLIESPINFYKIGKNAEVSGKAECDRFIMMVDYLAKKNYTMPIYIKPEESDDEAEYEETTIEIGKFFAAVQFGNNAGYLSEESNVNADYSFFITISQQDGADEAITQYMEKMISDEELKEKLDINKAYEESVLGIKHIEKPEETLKRFAIENGFAKSEEDISTELLENVLIPGNEEIIAKFSLGEISDKALMNKLGFVHEFAEMYFSLAKVNISQIEAKLQELKRSFASKKEMQKSALLVTLYCYIVEEQIACGPKSKAPKRNKGLKPEKLRELLAA